MLCQNCNKRQANTHIKKIVNNKLEEKYLCNECAENMGYKGFLSGFAGDFNSFFGLGDMKILSNETVRCECCGSSYDEIARTGKVGCANCYKVFNKKITPSIIRIHGNTTHTGKITSSVSPSIKAKNTIEQLKKELSRAIEEQEFEKAAELRDKIKSMEGEINNE